jgi:pyruvate dehydrogenase E2 component (dihydrolipoamide acetyltransferase)
MAVEITIPRLGWNMEEGIFIGWLKRNGERVVAGEPLFSLEGDKATQDVESLETGIVRIPPDGPKDGERVVVGAVIGYVTAADEGMPLAARSEDRPSAAVVNSSQATVPDSVLSPPAQQSSRQRISPRARRAARELAIETAGLTGRGKSGRIVERDVRAAAGAKSTAGRAPTVAPSALGPPPSALFEELAVTAIRKTTAERMLQSARTTAAVTLTTTVNATNLVNLRQQFKAVGPTREAPAIGYSDIVIKLTALALENHPMLNAAWAGETIRVWRDVHIGIAVDTEAGLLVPVIRDVRRLTLRQVAVESRSLIDRARAGKLTGAEMQVSTFTVTNLGAMGIEVFTPIINPPECAILGLGRIQNQVVVENKQFVARDRMTMSLTFDHRIVDGAPAARFLQSLGSLIEYPSPWLLA